MVGALTRAQVLDALQDVKDPEIPLVSIVELGMVAGVEVAGERVAVKITPTFVGCPAVAVIRAEVAARLRALGAREVDVEITLDPPWDSNRITPEGRRKLTAFGLAPPRPYTGELDLIQIAFVSCPFCGSADTRLESAFGATLCRAIHYCHACQQSFEQFKPL